MRLSRGCLLFVLLSFLLPSCSFVNLRESGPQRIPSGVEVIPPSVRKELSEKGRGKERKLIKEASTQEESTREMLHWYPKRFSVYSRATKGSLGGKKHSISLSYDTISVYRLVTVVFHDLLKKNVVVEGDLKPTISMSISGNFTEGEIVDIVSKVLESSGYTLTYENGVYYIKPAKTMPQSALSSSFRWWVYKPRYLSAKDLYKVLLQLKGKDAMVSLVAGNVIVVADDVDRISDYWKVVRVIDIDVFSMYDIRVFKLRYSMPSEVQKEVDQLTKSVGLKPGEMISLIPVDRLGFLLSITSSKELGDRIAAFVKLLDAPSETGKKEVYVYRVQHVEAKKLAETISNFLSGKGEVKGDKKKGKESASLVKGRVVIVPDETTNTLLIEASPKDYAKIREIIAALDAMPRQVLIEMLIAEISLEKEFEYGIEWWLKAHGHTFSAEMSTTFGLAGSKSKLVGFQYYDINPDNFWNFLYFLITNSKVNIISSPRILVRDNEKAKIDVGKEVPILTLETVGSTQIQGTSAIDRRVEYRDVGVILEVKPHISEEGFVSLDISEETSTPEPNTISGIDSPIISKRKVTTTLLVKSGHTVVIGGIIDNRKEKVTKGIPILSNLPFIGKLFSYERWRRSRTELIVMITPYVINNTSEADIITAVFKERLKSLIGASRSEKRK